ncbi:tRNA pseudouridine(13) synthase TruD [Tahibacter amnicola]|uniref:tRNA pseudouridine synthase D n=1 Tax=Tahibacter amnicola TaxID=2976241 RepID=A0ABY6BL00_9GAMM|nr:tRNA pseudouridine(13) synthase TruD [Tahibacter amnicola]UXI69710.1 tRNA pseudouridine(13) synthase TruD [Tahibacter amnicola]
MSSLPFAHGGPVLTGQLRCAPEDFRVDEDLGFEPDGAGEHVFVRVEKRGANTDWVAAELARWLDLPPEAVSYAGLKDRHAVTRQTFSIAVPIKRSVDWSSLAHPEFRVLDAVRHGRKLKRGALRGNAFRIVLRSVCGDRAQAEERIAIIRERGVPNYFGEQRFGRDGANLDRALEMFRGRRVARQQRSLLISAARSHLFNEVLARRVAAQSWNQAMDGDVWMLDGSHSIFGPQPVDEQILRRLADRDIHPTGPLWGRGALRSTGAVADLEQSVAGGMAECTTGLEGVGLNQERRSLRLPVTDLQAEWADDALTLSFWLPAGAYATTVLRELCGSPAGDPADAMQE